MEAFKDDLNLYETVKIPKIQIHRGKRQLTVNTTLNSLNDLDVSYALPKGKRGQGN